MKDRGIKDAIEFSIFMAGVTFAFIGVPALTIGAMVWMMGGGN